MAHALVDVTYNICSMIVLLKVLDICADLVFFAMNQIAKLQDRELDKSVK